MLAEKFVRHTAAVDVESLLDALAQYTPELLRRDAYGERKAVQEQLDWYEGPGYVLEALSASSSATADEVPLQACSTACNLALHLPTGSLYTASLSYPAFGCTLMDVLFILHTMLLPGYVGIHFSVVNTNSVHMWQQPLWTEQEARRTSARLGASAAHPWQHVAGHSSRKVFFWEGV